MTVDEYNPINTAANFLLMHSDARSAAMGNLSAATSPDLHSQFTNHAKYVEIENKFGAAFSYTPWLSSIVPDVNISSTEGFVKVYKDMTVSFGMIYYSLGNFEITDNEGYKLNDFRPNEYAFSGSFAMPLSENLFAGIGFRYICSNLTDNLSALNGFTFYNSTSIAADISVYYRKDLNLIGNGELAFGTNISNIGQKMQFSGGAEEKFLPTNFKLGGIFAQEIDADNKISVGIDVNKLLVPSTPDYDTDGTIISGKDPNVSVSKGIFQSFNDAPNGFSEELHEFAVSYGFEYLFSQKFAIRAGYSQQHETKGNNKYLTTGLGLNLDFLDIDFSYIIADKQTNPLANTIRISLGFKVGQMEN